MKSLILKLSLFPLFITGCTNVTVQAPQQATAPTIPVTKTSSEPSKPSKTVAMAAVNEIPEPPTTVSTGSSSSCNYYAGKAVEGQSVNVDLCSVSPRNSGAIAFSYTLGSKRMESQANCDNGTWTTFYDGKTHRPLSLATEKMINRVCGDRLSSQTVGQSATSSSGAAIVFDPPSNVRVSPGGAILCSVKRKTTINIYGSVGSWYNTDVCGTMGVISGDQIRF